MDYNEILDDLLSSINIISEDKQYWFLRTQSGSLYNLFLENKIIGIEHNELSLSETLLIYNTFGDKRKDFSKEYKSRLRNIIITICNQGR